MKIRHFLYNAFVVESDTAKIAVDPGQNLWLFRFCSLIPKSEWTDVTHILITHGDPDHHWQSDRMAQTSGAHVICGRSMTKTISGRMHLIAPRGKGAGAWTPFDRVCPLDPGDTVDLDGVKIQGLKAVHGPIELSIFGFRIRREPGPKERTGMGAMGFRIDVGGKTLVNLGDTILLPDWKGLKPDVLMIPIGGLGGNTWTMDVSEAVEAVRMIEPKIVIPCHYNAAFLWKKNAAPADDQRFRDEVERLGVRCEIMKYGEEFRL